VADRQVVDTNRDTTYAGSVGNASGTARLQAYNIRERKWQFDGCVSVYETYTIEARDYVYVCQEHISGDGPSRRPYGDGQYNLQWRRTASI